MSLRVVANLLLAKNGATTIKGHSAGLRTREDGERFHEIRKSAKAALIGGNTFRNEPYNKSVIPVFVSSNTLPEQNTRNLQISKLSPEELLAVAIETVGVPVIVEGGPNFLAPLLASKAIDRFYISRVLISGDDNYFSEQLLQVNYKKIESFSKNETTFETWEPVF